MTIKYVGKTVYDTDSLKIVANVKNLLEYFDDFTRSVAENSLWYLDTDGTTANTNTGSLTQAANNDGAGGSKDICGIIPLNRCSFFEELVDKMLPPMQLKIYVASRKDDGLIHMTQGRDARRVVVSRFNIWIQRITHSVCMIVSFHRF